MDSWLKNQIRKIDEPMQKLCENFYIHPNILTIFRILLIPVIIQLSRLGSPKMAFIVFIIAWVLDLLDGPMARVHNVESKLGAFLDPLADKLLFLSVFFLFWPDLHVIFIPVLCATALIEFTQIINRIKNMIKKIDIRAYPIGKIKSIIQHAGAALLLLSPKCPSLILVGCILLSIGLFFSAMSLSKQLKRT